MSKVGILSMQKIKNYGSFLQAYALKKLIEELGHNVEFVDYHIGETIVESNSVCNNKLSKGINAIKSKGKLYHKIKYIIHKKNFAKRYFKILGINENVNNYNPKLDTLVIGSDEVFNCIQSNANVGYSLELFGKDNNAKKVITYAASFGNTTIDKIKKYNKEKELSTYLNKIQSISVRDNNSGNIVTKLTGKETYYNLDPVLIYNFIQNKEIPSLHIKDKYLLLYAYSNRISKEEGKKIKEYAKANNLKVYSIGGVQPYADKFIDCSPFEVLAYFKNATCVITDTFHGSIFSIINHCKFVTLVRKSIGNSYGNEEKLVDLLERLSLTSRIVYDLNNLNSDMDRIINYAKVDKIIQKERNNSKKYLSNNLE